MQHRDKVTFAELFRIAGYKSMGIVAGEFFGKICRGYRMDDND